ncbi:MAG: DUF4174 domain-containing protein [Syntrophobacterales bacterium]
MKYICLLLGSLLVLGAANAALGKGGDMDKADLSRYRWQHRLLLIFSPSAQTPAFQQLASQLKQQRGGAADRDLLVFSIMSAGQSRVGEGVLSRQAAENLRRRFQVAADEFRVVLIGKDGTVKLSEPAVRLSEVFALIDSMPMRQREMREKAQ